MCVGMAVVLYVCRDGSMAVVLYVCRDGSSALCV